MAERDYRNDRISVHWDSSRCIHAARCVRSLPEVFDFDRRPWVDVNAAEADAVARTVELCPTGALRYTRHDGQPGERPPVPTRVTPVPDGPLVVEGHLEVQEPGGGVVASGETRLALCRCGRSRNQPFCDNSHLEAGFRSGEHRAEIPDGGGGPAAEGPTRIVPVEDGPLQFTGPLAVHDVDGSLVGESSRLVLCRCGRSSNRPLCDGSHRQGFDSCTGEVAPERDEAESPARFESNADRIAP